MEISSSATHCYPHPSKWMSTNHSAALVARYHQITKHSLRQGYSLGPLSLDWSSQPNPFREYQSSSTSPKPLPIPLQHSLPTYPYSSLFKPYSCASLAVNTESISQLLYNSLALSATKRVDESEWHLRVNPSSGNLHPTEAYWLDKESLYHYNSKEHTLFQRCDLKETQIFEDLCEAAGFTSLLPKALVGLTSISWREAWKYGTRAFRYCNLDIGHAIACIKFAGNLNGWSVKVVDTLNTLDLECIMGIDQVESSHLMSSCLKEEREHPHLLLAIFDKEIQPGVLEMKNSNSEKLRPILSKIRKLSWKGTPLALSRDHVCWKEIDDVIEAIRIQSDCEMGLNILCSVSRAGESSGSNPPKNDEEKEKSAVDTIRNRRSVWEMDSSHSITSQKFYKILEKFSRTKFSHFWDCVSHWPIRIQSILFVHRVDDIEPGIYLLYQGSFEELEAQIDAFKSADRLVENSADSIWNISLKSHSTVPIDFPSDLHFIPIIKGDARRVSKLLSCNQNIASHGCFTISMMGNLKHTLLSEGSIGYERMHWESGIMGQILYLGAEAVSLSTQYRGTGIGCFFDSEVHELLHFSDDFEEIMSDSTRDDFQVIYHFAVGVGISDHRIQTLDPYDK